MEIEQISGRTSEVYTVEGRLSAVAAVEGTQSWLFIAAEADKAIVDISMVGRI